MAIGMRGAQMLLQALQGAIAARQRGGAMTANAIRGVGDTMRGIGDDFQRAREAQADRAFREQQAQQAQQRWQQQMMLQDQRRRDANVRAGQQNVRALAADRARRDEIGRQYGVGATMLKGAGLSVPEGSPGVLPGEADRMIRTHREGLPKPDTSAAETAERQRKAKARWDSYGLGSAPSIAGLPQLDGPHPDWDASDVDKYAAQVAKGRKAVTDRERRDEERAWQRSESDRTYNRARADTLADRKATTMLEGQKEQREKAEQQKRAQDFWSAMGMEGAPPSDYVQDLDDIVRDRKGERLTTMQKELIGVARTKVKAVISQETMFPRKNSPEVIKQAVDEFVQELKRVHNDDQTSIESMSDEELLATLGIGDDGPRIS